MPLTRATMTTASRIMLPADAAFAGILGAAWAFQNPERTNLPALSALRDVWPINGTGVILLALAVAVIGGLLSHSRLLAAVALGVGFLTYAALTVAVLASLIDLHWGWPLVTFARDVSLASWAFFAYIAMAHLASMVSLAKDEMTDDRGNHRWVA